MRKSPLVVVPQININPALSALLVPIEKLSQDPDNVRVHTAEGLRVLQNALTFVGQQKPIIHRDRVVIAGNGLFLAAQALKWPEIAAVEFQGTPAEARRFAIQDNRSAELSMFDYDRLPSEFRWFEKNDLDPTVLGFTASQVESFLINTRLSDAPFEQVDGGAETDAASPKIRVLVFNKEQVDDVLKSLNAWARPYGKDVSITEAL